ncbi:unnamed protein product [[Candida] boidinii]|nr:unnamed protein product [[Candida] boidinii]
MFNNQSKSSTGTDESSSPIIEPSNAKNFATNTAAQATCDKPTHSTPSSNLSFNLPTPLLKSVSTTSTTPTSILSNSVTGSSGSAAAAAAAANSNTNSGNINSGKFEFNSNVGSPDSSQEEIDNISSCSESAVAPTI